LHIVTLEANISDSQGFRDQEESKPPSPSLLKEEISTKVEKVGGKELREVNLQ